LVYYSFEEPLDCSRFEYCFGKVHVDITLRAEAVIYGRWLSLCHNQSPFSLFQMNFFGEEIETSDDVVRGTNDDATVSRS
jgi:hypothetical protein